MELTGHEILLLVNNGHRETIDQMIVKRIIQEQNIETEFQFIEYLDTIESFGKPTKSHYQGIYRDFQRGLDINKILNITISK